ncbi:MAG TPA: CDF family Co(II)/Ni(II) efflux transporter DmeF [Burkholderiaceae bacterium]|jgi:cation diffusion facilitator family transporter
MNHSDTSALSAHQHHHVFLGKEHHGNERRTWAVIWLCGFMMLAEIIGGSLFGSLALVADGLHMSTHAGALLIAALAYTYSRRHAHDARFVFGTGKLGDLAGFTSAIALAMIALLIGYEAVERFLNPIQINFNEAIPIAIVGLLVNVVSAWLLSGDDHHSHSHGHSHGHSHESNHDHVDCGNHADDHDHHAATHRDNNMRAAYVHVIADAAVSILAIVGLVLGRQFGWVWMDPAAGIVGAFVIISWSYGLLRDTGGILLDMNSDQRLADKVKNSIEGSGDQLADLHLWRLGPGHMGAIVSVLTNEKTRDPAFYRARLKDFSSLSHITIEIHQHPETT